MNTLRTLFRLLTTFALASALSAAEPAGRKDTLMIVGVTPDAFVDGIATDVQVKLAYELVTRAEAVVEIAANTLRPQGMSSISSTRVQQGSGFVTLKGTIVPRFWTRNVPARISAFLVFENPQPPLRAVSASDETRIAVVLRPGAPEQQAVNPNPGQIHEDGIVIESITPDTFIDGQPVEIEVKVRYELRSRERGEINLGSSDGRASGYRIIGRTQVPAGKGEAVVRGRFLPKRTGTLPVARVHVNLSEFPHRPRWSPLATDAEIVDVR